MTSTQELEKDVALEILSDPQSYPFDTVRSAGRQAADIIKALSERVRVKPLQWNECRALYGGRKLIATDCFGREYARLDLKGQPDDFINDFKARVQEAYNAAILSALEGGKVDG